ncbi:MAG: transposase [Bacteroidales bacterium]|jgi:putative transposase|nr:transposase [Bacteroidales bacterium]
MRKSRFTENEMVRAVKQFESGVSADTISRELGISRMTLYKWKSKYSGMDVSQVKHLKELEEENRKLKQMYANLALDNQILKEVIEKKL